LNEEEADDKKDTIQEKENKQEEEKQALVCWLQKGAERSIEKGVQIKPLVQYLVN
jgi:hypothetical protein